MKKSDLLAKITTLIAATDDMPEDAEIKLVTIDSLVYLYVDHLPHGKINSIGSHEYTDLNGVTFAKERTK